MNENPLKIAAFYGRVSGADEDSIDNQLQYCREVARKDGYVIPDDPQLIYQDYHVSGAVRDRRGLDQLRSDITSDRHKGIFDRVYIRARDRIWRGEDPRVPYFWIVMFEEHNVQIRFAQERAYVDYSTGFKEDHIGDFFTGAAENVAAASERRKIRENTRTARRRLAKDGYWPGGAPPYGLERVLVNVRTGEVEHVYQRGQSISIPGTRCRLRVAEGSDAAEAVLLIYQWIAEGASLCAVAQRLAGRGYRSPSGKSSWNVSFIHDIATNPLYKGTLIWGKWDYHRGARGRTEGEP